MRGNVPRMPFWRWFPLCCTVFIFPSIYHSTPGEQMENWTLTKRRKQRGGLKAGMFCCQRYFLPLAFCWVQDNDALCAGTGSGGRWSSRGSAQPTAAAKPGATANNLPQRGAGADSAQLFWRKDTIENFRDVGNWWAAFIKRTCTITSIVFWCCFLFALIHYFYTVFLLFSLLCFAVYTPSLSLKVRIAKGIDNEFDLLGWDQGNSAKTQC